MPGNRRVLKKSTKGVSTPKKEIDLIRQRLAEAQRDYRERQNIRNHAFKESTRLNRAGVSKAEEAHSVMQFSKSGKTIPHTAHVFFTRILGLSA
jgi:hypothetical protein